MGFVPYLSWLFLKKIHFNYSVLHINWTIISIHWSNSAAGFRFGKKSGFTFLKYLSLYVCNTKLSGFKWQSFGFGTQTGTHGCLLINLQLTKWKWSLPVFVSGQLKAPLSVNIIAVPELILVQSRSWDPVAISVSSENALCSGIYSRNAVTSCWLLEKNLWEMTFIQHLSHPLS